ncbi:MAG: antibiotic biosynthesis monooxygenase [Pseudomonadota bacterium]
MIIVEGYVRMETAGDFEKVRAAAEAQIAASRAEGGCIDYTYALDVLDPQIMRVLERWDSWDALERHFQQPHMSVWRAALSDVTFLERSLRAHEVSETRDV